MATNGNDQRQQIGVDGNQHFFFWEKTLKTKQSIENSGTDGGQKAKNTADSSIQKKIDIDIDTKGSVEWLVEFQTRVFCRQLVPQHSTIDATVPSIPIDPRLANRAQ